MRRVGMLFDRILERDNLRLAVWKAMRGKRNRADVREFVGNQEENLRVLGRGLAQGDYPLGKYSQFWIHDPKKRLITAPVFAERVLHQAIMNICEPIFDRWLITDSFACRVGKGRLAALNRARFFSSRLGHYLKMDVRKYFDSIEHRRMLFLLGRRFKDPRLLALWARLLASHRRADGRGLPIGSLISQHLANFFLGWFDHQVKEVWRIQGYVRYMDDMVLWSDWAVELRELLPRIRDYLGQNLGLELKPVLRQRSRHGLEFLGCRVYPGQLTLNRKSRVRCRRRLHRLELLHALGILGERELQDRATAVVAFTRAGRVTRWPVFETLIE